MVAEWAESQGRAGEDCREVAWHGDRVRLRLGFCFVSH